MESSYLTAEKNEREGKGTLMEMVGAWGRTLDLLSGREQEVIALAANGCTDEQISQRMGISTSTVNSYWVRIRGKVGFYSRTEIVALMLRHEMRQQQARLAAENARLQEELGRAHAELAERKGGSAIAQTRSWEFPALHMLPEAVLVTEPPATVAYANVHALALYRASPGELNGLSMRELTTAQTPEAIREPCRELFAPGGPGMEVLGLDAPYYALRRDGTNFRAIVRARRFETPSGPRVTLVLREIMADVDTVLNSFPRALA